MNVVCLEVQELAYFDNQEQITESTKSKVGLNITKVEDSYVYGFKLHNGPVVKSTRKRF